MVIAGVFGVRSMSGARWSSGRKRLHRGFTLIELMVGLVLVTILMGIGLPMFRSFILEQRLRATSSDLRVALTIARSEAIKHNRLVAVSPSADGWGKGWTVESPIAGEPDILNNVEAGDVAITTLPAGTTPRFSPSGRAATALKFEIDAGPEGSGSVSCLQMQLDGRMTSTKGSCPNG